MSGLPLFVCFFLVFQGVIGGGLSFFEVPDQDPNMITDDLKDIKDMLQEILDYITHPDKLWNKISGWVEEKVKTGITWIGGTISGLLNWIDTTVTKLVLLGGGVNPTDPEDGEESMIQMSIRLLGACVIIAGLWLLFRFYTLALEVLPFV
jgi:hypothetical protein